MSHTKGELQIKKAHDEMYVHYWENGESFMVGAYHRPNKKEQAIINRLVLCWNTHDTLTKQLAKVQAGNSALLMRYNDLVDEREALTEKKCGNCNHWFMERNGECGLEVHHNKSYRFDSKACKAWAEVPGANEKPAKKFYHIGQRFRCEDTDIIYKLVSIDAGIKVMMVQEESGIGFWSRSGVVGDEHKITEDEFAKICGCDDFTLIE